MSTAAPEFQEETNTRERRNFHRVTTPHTGEFVWKSKLLLGRHQTEREFVTTQDLGVNGARIVLPGEWKFSEGDRGRLKVGPEHCDAKVLEATTNGVATTLRLTFVNPSPQFTASLVILTDPDQQERFSLKSLWGKSR